MLDDATDLSQLFHDDSVEFTNVPYTDWPDLLNQHVRFRINHETADESGFEYVQQLREGLLIRVLDLTILADSRVKVRALADYVSCFFNLSGHYFIIDGQGEEHPHVKGTCGIVFDKDAQVFEDFCSAGVRYKLVEVLIHKDQLYEEFFQKLVEDLPLLLRPVYMEGEKFIYHNFVMDAEIHQALDVLVAADCGAAVKDKFLQAKCIELICLMMRLLMRQQQSLSLQPLKMQDIKRLELARKLLLADLMRPPTIAALAQQLGFEKGALQQKFKQCFGLSCRQFIVQSRMEKAKSLLSQQDVNINQMAWQLGYEHACNFVTAFKRHYGVTPKAYRLLVSKTESTVM